jgi:hypothetical protein
MAGLPWTKFYWEKWDGEAGLRLCSLAAQGLWMRLLCLMAKENGHLKINGKRPSLGDIARVIGHPSEEILPLMRELEQSGVFDRTQGGVIYCRRMARGESVRGEKTRDRREKTRVIDLKDNLFNDMTDHIEEEEEEEREESPPAPKGAEEVREAIRLWNEVAEANQLPKAIDLTDDRVKKIKARLKEAGMAGWRQALEAVAASRHCLGINDRGWKANLDFVASPSGFAKLREGFYGRNAPKLRLVETASPWVSRMWRWEALKDWDTVAWGPPPDAPDTRVPEEFRPKREVG